MGREIVVQSDEAIETSKYLENLISYCIRRCKKHMDSVEMVGGFGQKE